MDFNDPVVAATQVVAERFPHCRAAFLSDGVLSPRRTPTSDLDIVVVVEAPPAPFRETISSHGWVVELFIHSRETLTHFYAFDALDRRCTLARMCTGYVIKDTDGLSMEIQSEARNLISAGPPALSSEERERRRYFLTDLLDDVRGTSDPVEMVFIASHLLQTAGTLLLENERRWTGLGKWLPRLLDEVDDDHAGRLADAFRVLVSTGNKEPLDKVVSSVLERAGGPLTEGYVVRGSPSDPERGELS